MEPKSYKSHIELFTSKNQPETTLSKHGGSHQYILSLLTCLGACKNVTAANIIGVSDFPKQRHRMRTDLCREVMILIPRLQCRADRAKHSVVSLGRSRNIMTWFSTVCSEGPSDACSGPFRKATSRLLIKSTTRCCLPQNDGQSWPHANLIDDIFSLGGLSEHRNVNSKHSRVPPDIVCHM